MGVLEGKVAVITGGGSGIGLATARLFAQEGAQVVVTGRRAEVIAAAAASIGKNALAVAGDIAEAAHREEVAATVASRFGQLDIYVANAGRIAIAPFSEVSEEAFDAQFDTNARGVFFGVQSLLPVMCDGGSIILVGSIASDKTLLGHAAYAGSKAALVAFSRVWALELKARRIRVNVLSPGPTDTGIIAKLGLEPEEGRAFVASLVGQIPLGRIGDPVDVAKAALFLASDAGRYLTGVNLRVDGGMALT
ncbi:glucose 1-dehydrogenase [Aurantimonas sp. 22II-16-19i]|uniref:SDR family NAD(P)-dependent oxidoreductase n=1 Tax=Aurantimonas sp. 22II-16-19i TaxID=1317114 RepID=UPI0009F7EA13|nr:glucose 1-dehydrogenase [Aurantimonas sp. 22II-16-19i]ORE97519.1 short-chain dehydrogenase/reductase SDR [Aurantimonas sp. 22II-16-19i]